MNFVLVPLTYVRGFIVTVFGIIHTFIMSILVVLTAGLTRSRRLVDFMIIWLWSMPIIIFSGTRVEVRGADQFGDSPLGFLILFNHSSLMDIPVLYSYFPRSFRFGAKIELFKIPFFGKAMEVCGVLPIDRSNRNKVMKVYEDAIARVKNGEAFALAPEGTRQKEATLGKFKRGPFEFALNAGMDIVPAVIAGAYDVLPRKAFLINTGRWRRKIIVQILPRVSTKDYTLESIDQLLEKVRNPMNEAYVQLTEELKGF